MAQRTFTIPRGRSWLWPSLLVSLAVVVVSSGAVAAMETDTVTSFWQGLWWSLSLITTVGFLGPPPHSPGGAVLSVVLMVVGFLLLAMVSASLAALFVRDEEAPKDAADRAADTRLLRALEAVEERLSRIEAALAERSSDTYAEAAADAVPAEDRAS